MSVPTTPPPGQPDPGYSPYPQQGYPQGYQQQPGQQGGHPGQYGYGGYPPVAPPANNTMAVMALVAGICGLTALPFIGSIAAVIIGPMAKKEIARTGEGGASLATWGQILGWVGIGIAVLGGLFFVFVWGAVLWGIGTTSGY
ncbi:MULTISPECIES: DUF4190 domain-containing protein [unclassified Actinotalea]|uniref:DUF4190 domain-containing protein n=1 Tax=unclassified Actinotalea TaxID=2638618 RepID=UPI0015F6E751|nr:MULTISPECIES: DUF4190 domain-containing protein [unclassified Actinotalea]